MSKENLLIVADSERDADMLYAVRMFVPDPFIYFRHAGKNHIVVSDLELNRARRTTKNCKVLSLSHYQQAAKKEGIKRAGLGHVIRLALSERHIRKISVPHSFPHGLAKQLRDLGIKVKVSRCCFPEREVKSAQEIKKISAALMMAEVGLAEGIEALKRSKVAKNGRLFRNNNPLTSERLRSIIDTAIIQAGGLANHTIVACGAQACDPHEQGYGALKANVPIIIDVFPRSQKTGYFGDITRTVVKGRSSEAVRKMYHTVAGSQEAALRLVTEGKSGKEVHDVVQRFFLAEGFKTGSVKGKMQGFFHGTGHGVGLEIHEFPRIGQNSNDILRAGHVVTVEPGLYYPGIGGIRLEDMAQVTKRGAINLTKFEKIMEV
jgi:Xaa-Pro aminopeptidase